MLEIRYEIKTSKKKGLTKEYLLFPGLFTSSFAGAFFESVFRLVTDAWAVMYDLV